MIYKGSVIKYGNDINTDIIIPGKYTKTLNFEDLKIHAMEDLDSDFQQKIETRKIVVTGDNFGCGSSREQAPLALKLSGVELIATKTVSRIFFRNAINIGLPVIQCDTDKIDDFDEVYYDFGDDKLFNVTQKIVIDVLPMPEIMQKILEFGGLTNFLLTHSDYE